MIEQLIDCVEGARKLLDALRLVKCRLAELHGSGRLQACRPNKDEYSRDPAQDSLDVMAMSRVQSVSDADEAADSE